MISHNYASTVDSSPGVRDAGIKIGWWGADRMDILEPSRRSSFWPDFQKKLEEGAPTSELQRLITLQMASILLDAGEVIDAIAPNQRNLRYKKLRSHVRILYQQFRGARELGKYINMMRRDRNRIDPYGRRFTYVLEQLATLAIDCLRKTGQNEHNIQNWAMHYQQQLNENLEDICKAANKL